MVDGRYFAKIVPSSCCDADEVKLCSQENSELVWEHPSFYAKGCSLVIPATIIKYMIRPLYRIIGLLIVIEVRTFSSNLVNNNAHYTSYSF